MATSVTPDVAMMMAGDSDPRCPRCAGLMVPDRFIDLLDDTGHLEFIAARCVSCGEVVDPVILHNRHRMHESREAANDHRQLPAQPLAAA